MFKPVAYFNVSLQHSMTAAITIRWVLDQYSASESNVGQPLRACATFTGDLKRELVIQLRTGDSTTSPQATSKEVIHRLYTCVCSSQLCSVAS